MLMLEVVNGTREPDGSFKRYALRVDPKCTTAEQAWWSLSPVKRRHKVLIET